jgi:hypothetical protein
LKSAERRRQEYEGDRIYRLLTAALSDLPLHR